MALTLDPYISPRERQAFRLHILSALKEKKSPSPGAEPWVTHST
jgi:hypothetical protein